MARLDNKVAIITGSAQGLGRSIAELFAAEGAAVVIADVSDDRGQATAMSIERAGGKALFQHLDVTSQSDWRDAVASCTSAFGPADILVSNALAWFPENVLDVSVEHWSKGLDVILNGTFHGVRAVLPGMRERGSGSIVSVASAIGGGVAIPAYASYQAAKAGMIALTRHVAVTYGGENIRANSLLPGPMYTEGLADSGFSQASEEIASTFPLARISQPAEVAAGALFLASDESSYMTGASLVIDGGQLAV